MAEMNITDKISAVLLTVGGLVHLGQTFGFYAVDSIFSFAPFLGKVVYFAVGVSAVYAIGRWFHLLGKQ